MNESKTIGAQGKQPRNLAFIDGQNLYKKLGSEYFDYLESVRGKIGDKKKRAP